MKIAFLFCFVLFFNFVTADSLQTTRLKLSPLQAMLLQSCLLGKNKQSFAPLH